MIRLLVGPSHRAASLFSPHFLLPELLEVRKMARSLTYAFRRSLVTCSIATLLVLLIGLARPMTPAMGQEEEAADQTEPAAEEPAEEPDPFVVPDGTAEEILAYMKTLRGRRPKVRDRRGYMEFQRKQNESLVAAADKVLAPLFDTSGAAESPTDEQAEEAARAKLAANPDFARAP